jgi:hypothetical protein
MASRMALVSSAVMTSWAVARVFGPIATTG